MLSIFSLFSALAVTALGYDLVREYAGKTFFDGFEYYGLYDNLTFGDVNWVDRNTAITAGLTYVSNQNTAVMRVDNYTTVPFNQKRNSVRITTTDFYELGSLWVFDAVHLPYGCSVWPAWWTKGPLWPDDGEIDIVENINMAQKNQMALHTTEGCSHSAPPDQRGSSPANPDCSPGSGCVVGDPDPRSWGKGFADAGGGVFATQFDVQGIFIWFWSRADLPDSLGPSAAATPLDISAWGPPTASFLAATCNISQFFTPQQLVLDITLCGDWAGVPRIYNSTCGSQPPNDPTNPVSSKIPHTPSCYADNVVGPGSRYDNAYFEINHIRAYTTTAAPSPTSSSPPTLASSTASGSGRPNVAAGTPTTNNMAIPNILSAIKRSTLAGLLSAAILLI